MPFDLFIYVGLTVLGFLVRHRSGPVLDFVRRFFAGRPRPVIPDLPGTQIDDALRALLDALLDPAAPEPVLPPDHPKFPILDALRKLLQSRVQRQ